MEILKIKNPRQSCRLGQGWMKKETTNMIVRSIGVPHSFFVFRKISAEPANGIIHDSHAGEKKK
jgi:hypothetical protein